MSHLVMFQDKLMTPEEADKLIEQQEDEEEQDLLEECRMSPKFYHNYLMK